MGERFVQIGEEQQRIGQVFCIGRNYVEHAKELGNAVPESPIVFLKPSSSIIFSGEPILLPAQSQDVHHEAELVLVLGKDGKNIPESKALSYIGGYGVGLDLTARDIQDKAKKAGQPWAVSKGFPTFCVLSNFVPADQISTFDQLSFQLFVNGELRQEGDPSTMIFTLPKLIHYLSTVFNLETGDLIFTGTPSGVKALQEGDSLELVLGEGAARIESVVMKG